MQGDRIISTSGCVSQLFQSMTPAGRMMDRRTAMHARALVCRKNVLSCSGCFLDDWSDMPGRLSATEENKYEIIYSHAPTSIIGDSRDAMRRARSTWSPGQLFNACAHALSASWWSFTQHILWRCRQTRRCDSGDECRRLRALSASAGQRFEKFPTC